MAKTVTVQQSYTGGGPSAMAVTTNLSGEGDLNFSQACNASATTTLSPAVVLNPATAAQGYSIQTTGGNATLAITNNSGTATTIALTDGVAKIVVGNGTTCGELPAGASTYTFSVRNAGSASITFEGRFLWT